MKRFLCYVTFGALVATIATVSPPAPPGYAERPAGVNLDESRSTTPTNTRTGSSGDGDTLRLVSSSVSQATLGLVDYNADVFAPLTYELPPVSRKQPMSGDQWSGAWYGLFKLARSQLC